MAISTPSIISELLATVTTTPSTLVGLGFASADVIRTDTVQISVNSGNDVRYWYGTLTPSASSGHFIPVYGELTITGANLVNGLTLVAETGSSSLSISLISV